MALREATEMTAGGAATAAFRRRYNIIIRTPFKANAAAADVW